MRGSWTRSRRPSSPGPVPDPKQRYLDARVEGATTLADAYNWHAEYPEVFVAGVQYALDKMLSRMDAVAEAFHIDDAMHNHAIDILEAAKRGEPQ